MTPSIRRRLSNLLHPPFGRLLFVTTLAVAATMAAGRTGARIAIPSERVPAAPHTVHAQAPASSGPAYALPVLDFFGEDDVCDSWVAVQNIGHRPAQPVIAFLRLSPTGSAPSPSDPAAHEPGVPGWVSCGGLIRPGTNWSFFGAQIATGSRSGVVLSLDGTNLTAAGADTAAGDDVIGGRLCELLRTRTANDPARWRAFMAAWQAGAAWEGMPLGRVAGPPLSVQVHRSCPGQRTPRDDTQRVYAAPRIVPSTADSHRAAVAPLSKPVLVQNWPEGGALYIQNTGVVSGTFRVRYAATDACAPPPPVETLLLGPLDTAHVDLMRAPDGWRGQAIVDGDAPFVLVGEPAADDWGAAEAVPSTPDGAGTRDHGPLAAVVPLAAGTHRLTVDVVNTGRSPFAPRVTVYGPAGRTGAPIAPPLVGADLCPGGHWTATTTLTVADGRLDGHLVWIEGQAGDAQGTLSATVRVEGVDPAAPDGPPLTAYDLTARPSNGAAQPADVRPVALPAGMDDIENSGFTHAIAVARTGTGVGRWDYVVQLYDRNGLIHRICRTLTDTAVDVLDLSVIADVPDGTKSAAVVAAVGWGGAEAPGDLAVTALWFRGAILGIDVPGDELAAVAGTPLDEAWSQVIAASLGAPCGPPAEPAPPPVLTDGPLQAALFVPTITYVGQNAACTAEVRVTNEGPVPVEIVRILWGEPGFYCEPNCKPPLSVRCTPLIAPGASFTFVEEPGSNSGVLLSLDGRSLDALGIAPGDDRTAAAVLCASDELAGSCSGWRRLWVAWQTGGTFADLPLDRVVGGRIAAVVSRSCASTGYTPAAGSASYPAIRAAEALAGETQPDRFVYSVADLRVPRDGRPNRTDSVVAYIQNAGTRCAAVTATFVSSTAPAVRVTIDALSAGEAYPLNMFDCVTGPWHGTLILSSNAPLSIAFDRHTNPLASSGVQRGALPPPTVDPLETPEPTSTSRWPSVPPTRTGVAMPTRTPTPIPSATADAQERLFLPELLRLPRP